MLGDTASFRSSSSCSNTLLGTGEIQLKSLRDCNKSRREQKEGKTSAFSDCDLSYLLLVHFLYYLALLHIMSLLELSSRLVGEDFDAIPVM